MQSVFLFLSLSIGFIAFRRLFPLFSVQFHTSFFNTNYSEVSLKLIPVFIAKYPHTNTKSLEFPRRHWGFRIVIHNSNLFYKVHIYILFRKLIEFSTTLQYQYFYRLFSKHCIWWKHVKNRFYCSSDLCYYLPTPSCRYKSFVK